MIAYNNSRHIQATIHIYIYIKVLYKKTGKTREVKAIPGSQRINPVMDANRIFRSKSRLSNNVTCLPARLYLYYLHMYKYMYTS